MCRQRILRPNKRRETPSRNCLQSKFVFGSLVVLVIIHRPDRFADLFLDLFVVHEVHKSGGDAELTGLVS